MMSNSLVWRFIFLPPPPPYSPREIVDSKCYSLSYEFVCQLLQPVCFQERLVLPCRSGKVDVAHIIQHFFLNTCILIPPPLRDFCLEFLDSCGNVLPVELRRRIDCDRMATEADGPGACISKPGR